MTNYKISHPLPPQAAWIIEDNRPPEDWPGSGHIAIETLDLRYRENLPLVLKNINCDIVPGEKVCIDHSKSELWSRDFVLNGF